MLGNDQEILVQLNHLINRSRKNRHLDTSWWHYNNYSVFQYILQCAQ